MEGHLAELVGGAVGTTLARSRLSEVIDRIRFYQVRMLVCDLCRFRLFFLHRLEPLFLSQPTSCNVLAKQPAV